jgi:hypothetical protein
MLQFAAHRISMTANWDVSDPKRPRRDRVSIFARDRVEVFVTDATYSFKRGSELWVFDRGHPLMTFTGFWLELMRNL